MGGQWIFGIDGGGTSARLRVEALSGGLLFYAEGGSSNLHGKPRAEVSSNLAGLFSRAFAEAGLSPSDCAAGFIGSAGIDREADKEPFAALLREAFAAAARPPAALAVPAFPLVVGNDTEPALVGAVGGVEGLLLIAGTGSIAYGRGRDGSEARAGGWGHLLGDEGSAFWVAFEAIKRGLRSREGRDLGSGLLEEALAFFGLAAPEDLIPFTYEGLDKTGIARFSRRVAAMRDSGDALAKALFEEAAEALAGLVLSVDRKVGGHIVDKRLAFRGGLIEGDASLRAAVTARLAAAIPGLSIVEAQADAASGACALARSLL
jgi:N-acetylglucosamine kinase-like BadF-type ATPase